MAKIKESDLKLLLDNEDTPIEEIKEFFEYDYENSDSFSPRIKVKERRVVFNESNADEGIMGLANKFSRRRRQKKYKKKVNDNFSGIKIVSEGDSWFQYPIFLKDIIDHLNQQDDYAIWSLGFGGDWLSNIMYEREYVRAIQENTPDFFLISGGGNDMVGKKRLATMLRYYDPHRNVEDYLTEEFGIFLDDMRYLYTRLFTNLTQQYPDMHIISHGYDYAIPDNEKWLGKPMKLRGISDRQLQYELIRLMLTRFNEVLEDVTSNFEKVHKVESLGTVDPNGWYDELHPTSDCFKLVADKFQAIIEANRS